MAVLGEMAQQENDDPAELESSLSRAIQLRAPYIKGQADNLTLTSVRRLLERDLGLKNLYLEEHKAVIKRLLDKVLNEDNDAGDDEEDVSDKPRKRRKNNSRAAEDFEIGELETRTVVGNRNKKRLIKKGDSEKEKLITKTSLDDAEFQDNLTEKVGEADAGMLDRQGGSVVEDPVKADKVELGKEEPLVQEGPSNSDKDEVVDKSMETKEIPVERIEETTVQEDNHPLQDRENPSEIVLLNTNETVIRLALEKRAGELKSQAESLTVTTVRNLLEQDLGLVRDGLKSQKQFIRKLVDELLAPSNEEGGTEPEKQVQVNGEGKPEKEAKSSLGRKSSLGEAVEESEEILQGNGEVSDTSDERRPNKAQKKRKKKDNEMKTKPHTEVKTKSPVVKKSADVKKPFSAQVERLRDILKFVGVGVSPLVYKKAKQAPEDERDEVLIKELESRLAQEGLSPSSTEKEMRKVKARLEKKRDLDGIECSNIVVEPRRSRAAANSWFAPRPNKYAQVADKTSEEQDSDDDSKPAITGSMDD